MAESTDMKRFIFAVGAFLTSVVIVLWLLFSFYLIWAWGYYHRHQSQSSYVGDSLIQEDPVIGFTQRPNITIRHTTPPEYTLYTDNLGARVGRRGLHSPRQVDMLAIGDSYTWGHGVNDESTFIKILGRSKNLVVSNLALGSYGTTTCLLSLKKFLFLKPKVVLYALIENDIRRSLEPCAPSWSPYCLSVPFVDFDQRGRPFIHPPAYFSKANFQYTKEILMEHPFGFRDIFWAIRRDWLRLTRKDQDSLNARYKHHQTQEFREKAMSFLLGEMVRTCRNISAKLILVYIPVMTDLKPAPPEWLQAVGSYVNGQDVFYADLTEPFQIYAEAHGTQILKAGGVDIHPSEAAHQIIATHLEPVIDKIERGAYTPDSLLPP